MPNKNESYDELVKILSVIRPLRSLRSFIDVREGRSIVSADFLEQLPQGVCKSINNVELCKLFCQRILNDELPSDDEIRQVKAFYETNYDVISETAVILAVAYYSFVRPEKVEDIKACVHVSENYTASLWLALSCCNRKQMYGLIPDRYYMERNFFTALMVLCPAIGANPGLRGYLDTQPVVELLDFDQAYRGVTRHWQLIIANDPKCFAYLEPERERLEYYLSYYADQKDEDWYKFCYLKLLEYIKPYGDAFFGSEGYKRKLEEYCNRYPMWGTAAYVDLPFALSDELWSDPGLVDIRLYCTMPQFLLAFYQVLGLKLVCAKKLDSLDDLAHYRARFMIEPETNLCCDASDDGVRYLRGEKPFGLTVKDGVRLVEYIAPESLKEFNSINDFTLTTTE